MNYSQKDDLGNKEKLNEELAAKNEELRAVEAKIKALQEETTPQIDNNDKIQQLQHDKTIIWGQVQCLQTRRDMLRKEYKEVANATPGICTHCGQAIPLETFKAKQAKKLAKMQKEGDEINAQLATYNEQLQDYEAHIQKLQDSQVHCGPDNSSQLLAQNLQEKLLLEREIDRIGQQLELIKEQDHRSARIAQLQNQQIQLENTMNELNIQLQLLKDFQQTKCRLIEQEINAKFQHVKFKLFDYYITTGEIKDCCEVLLDDKPYSSALSTGERVKASLDCIKTLQEHFKVELPIFIDDAESITSNSSSILTNMPNQVFMFKVVEGQNLKVEVS